MTKKHFEALAEMFRFTEFESARDRETSMYEIARICAAFNHNFDTGRFISACNKGVNHEEK